jgi:hypothetical protein
MQSMPGPATSNTETGAKPQNLGLVLLKRVEFGIEAVPCEVLTPKTCEGGNGAPKNRKLTT